MTDIPRAEVESPSESGAPAMSEVCPKCGAGVRRDTYQVGERHLSRWLCGSQEHINGSIMRSTECYENEIGCLKEQLTQSQAAVDQYKQWWETSCLHVKEALELLGVDVSADGYAPDTWTLREQCKRNAATLAAMTVERDELRRKLEACAGKEMEGR